ncbi:MAG: TetR/AcrR family transcriptional regulator C-terminal domain-containing protein [Gordonia sp. (in: high G+C Gram-positive bacteria)]
MAGRITLTAIVDEAFALLDDAGIDGLTLRALAGRLGVKAPALYWHVASKQALIDEMGTEIARRIAVAVDDAPPTDDFAEALRHTATTMRAEYLRHRDGARTFSGTRLSDPALMRGQEDALGKWTARGMTVEQVVDAFEIVTAFVVGFVIEEQERADESRYAVADRDEAVGEEYPLAVAAGHHLLRSAEQRFAEQLALVTRAFG